MSTLPNSEPPSESAPEPSGLPQVLSQQRFCEMLASIQASKHLSQRQIASRLSVPVQYLSGYKLGRLQMSERVARRIEEQFGFPWRWLMGTSDVGPATPPVATASERLHAAGSLNCLPILPHPIEGEPRYHPKWDGALIEVYGAAQAKLNQATMPYVLRFGAEDRRGRLKQGDLLLMSQSLPLRDANYDSYIQVIRGARGLYLARKVVDGWERLAASEPLLPLGCTVHGYAVGILWGSLL